MSQFYGESIADPRKNSGTDTYPIGYLMSVVEGERAFLLHKQGSGVWVEINPYKVDADDLIKGLREKADSHLIHGIKEESNSKINLLNKVIADVESQFKSHKDFIEKSLENLSRDVHSTKFTLSEVAAKSDKEFIITSIEALKVTLIEEARKVTIQSAETISKSVDAAISKSSALYAEKIKKDLESEIQNKILAETEKIAALAVEKAKETVRSALGSLKL